MQMGYKKGKLRDERMYRQSEQIMLNSAKEYYKQADMWLSARDAAETIDNMKAVAEKSIAFTESLLQNLALIYVNGDPRSFGI